MICVGQGEISFENLWTRFDVEDEELADWQRDAIAHRQFGIRPQPKPFTLVMDHEKLQARMKRNRLLNLVRHKGV